MSKLIHPITSIDKLVKKNELGQPSRLSNHHFDQDGRLGGALSAVG
jgi:hypothetical protein